MDLPDTHLEDSLLLPLPTPEKSNIRNMLLILLVSQLHACHRLPVADSEGTMARPLI